MRQTKNILIAPLNWGLGHAARCIPIIKNLQQQGHHIIIASDGAALTFLQAEFPDLSFEKLPAYHITYARKPRLNIWHLWRQIPHILNAIRQERQKTQALIQKYGIDILISDNRFGVYAPQVKSIYITHQLQVLSGPLTWLSTWIHAQIYKKFDEIWVPDLSGNPNLSGRLGHPRILPDKVNYIGPLSRMARREVSPEYDVLAILSGPEPQRYLLEEKLLSILSQLDLKSALVQGRVEGQKTQTSIQGVTVYNYLTTQDLESLINRSENIILRSGYTSIMDMVVMQKKVLLIPTPGQPEQEYLAKHLALNFGILFQKQQDIVLNRDLFFRLSPFKTAAATLNINKNIRL